MSFANAIRDIPPGSTWVGASGRLATVLCAAACFVTLAERGSSAQARQVSEREFRATFRPRYDREQVRKQFSMTVANLGEFRVYWLPDLSRILCRSIACRRHFEVPDGAELVGTYAHPCTAREFLADLDDLLERIEEGARP